jgi:hypothetical protein
MADAKVTSLVSSTIDTLEATTKHYSIVKDDKSLREAFHEAGRGLLLVRQALQATNSHLHERNLAGDPQNAVNSLEACNTKAKLSESIFKAVAQAPEISRFEHYKEVLEQLGKENTVEVLTIGMMRDVCNLAENDAIKAAMKDEAEGLRGAMVKLAKMRPSVPNERSGDTYSNYGSGPQYNAPGSTQNITTGHGNQFPGATFSGSVSFGGNRP